MYIIHLRIHSNEKNDCCNECLFFFSFVLDTLQKHMQTHTEEKPNSCSHFQTRSSYNKVCDHTCKHILVKSHIVAKSLHVHQQIHTDENPYMHAQNMQNVLDYMITCKFIYNLTLEKKPFSCTECGKCFPSSTDFQFHMKNHTAERHHSSKHMWVSLMERGC